MNGNNSVPNIRFKGFQDDWENDSIKNVSTMKSGGTPSVNKREYYVGDIPFIRSSDIKKKTTELKINDEALKNSSSFVVEKGTVLYALYGATSGQVAISKVTGAINQAVLAIFPDEFVNKYFLLYWLSFNKGKITNKYLQGGQGNLSAKIVKNLLLFFPSKQEQQKIGNFFAKLDKLLDLQQQKINKLDLLKKVLLQKLFPKHDAKIPDLRFKGYEEDWAKIQLKNYVTWYKGSGLSKKYLNVEKIGVPVIHYSDLYKFSEVIKNVRHWSTTNQGKLVSNNSILFPSSDVTPNGLARTSALIKNGVKAGGDIIIGTLKTSLSNVFMSYQINRNYKDILRMVSGTTIRHIHAYDLSNLSEYITYYSEQQKIGNLLSKVDHLIELENKKLQNFQQIKKCLLQNMFVE